LGNVHRHIIGSTFPILCRRRRRTVKRARSLHAAAGGARLAHRNFAAHCSNIERPGGGAFARAHSYGQSAQGRGVCAGMAQVSRASPPVHARHARCLRLRESDRATGRRRRETLA